MDAFNVCNGLKHHSKLIRRPDNLNETVNNNFLLLSSGCFVAFFLCVCVVKLHYNSITVRWHGTDSKWENLLHNNNYFFKVSKYAATRKMVSFLWIPMIIIYCWRFFFFLFSLSSVVICGICCDRDILCPWFKYTVTMWTLT